MGSQTVQDRFPDAIDHRPWRKVGIAGLAMALGLTALVACSSGSDVTFHDDCDRQAYEETRTNYLEAVNRDFDAEYQSVHQLCHTFSS